MEKHIKAPLSTETALSMNAGDYVYITGTIYTARDAAGARLSKSITASEVVAYDDLGTEAIRKLEVENFPVIVVIDAKGNNLYETAVKEIC